MKTPLLFTVIAGLSLSGITLLQAEDPASGPSKPKSGPKPPEACEPKGAWGGGGHTAGKGGDMLGHMLQLTPEQKEKVKAIWDAQKPKIQAIREEERVKMKAIFDDVDKQMRPLLTADQISVLDNAKKLHESQAALRKDKVKGAGKSE